MYFTLYPGAPFNRPLFKFKAWVAGLFRFRMVASHCSLVHPCGQVSVTVKVQLQVLDMNVPSDGPCFGGGSISSKQPHLTAHLMVSLRNQEIHQNALNKFSDTVLPFGSYKRNYFSGMS